MEDMECGGWLLFFRDIIVCYVCVASVVGTARLFIYKLSSAITALFDQTDDILNTITSLTTTVFRVLFQTGCTPCRNTDNCSQQT